MNEISLEAVFVSDRSNTASIEADGRLSLNTGAGTLTPEAINSLVELIDAGIR